MTWRAPNGETYRHLDIDIIASYFTESDFEDYLDELNPEVPVLDGIYGEGYIRSRLSYGEFKAMYNEQLSQYLDDPEGLGFEKVDDESAYPGGVVSEAYYEEMRDTVPPLDVPKEVLSRYGCTRGFMMGEPYGTDSKGNLIYQAYGRRRDGTCLYLGVYPSAEKTVSYNARTGKVKSASVAEKGSSKPASAPRRNAGSRPAKSTKSGGKAPASKSGKGKAPAKKSKGRC